ncbi:PREDICTED: G patch domain-containing protein 11-like [Branchiostoma belcheri]|uniref:G patch domain-containing protein 11 n=1 Tax=Branchiostoma belcheri TaxID=7741 RepID=A0A6P4YNQ9_BRABE|nr:PREDICTED: G patch domain-containing protein 11-like [Branchiostoma belcheri]
MADGDDLDYMSDAILQQTSDVRPGLPVLKRVARQRELEKKQKEANERSRVKPLKQQQAEKRDEALSQPISSDNIGFKMLQKMGFKQGQGLGRLGKGRAEPVPLEVKADRTGMGLANEQKRKADEMNKMRQEMQRKRQRMEELERGDFTLRMKSRFTEREVQRDLYKSQKVCEQLDSAKSITEPVAPWYWPKIAQAKDEEEEGEEGDEEKEETEEEEDELQPEEMLQELTSYLRREHLYCLWCGTAYNDEKDLADNCPGDDAAAHG